MSKQRWSIRKARADDTEALAACMDAAYRPYMERLGDAPLPSMTADYHEEIASYPVWVVEVEGFYQSDSPQKLGRRMMKFDRKLAPITRITSNSSEEKCDEFLGVH